MSGERFEPRLNAAGAITHNGRTRQARFRFVKYNRTVRISQAMRARYFFSRFVRKIRISRGEKKTDYRSA